MPSFFAIVKQNYTQNCLLHLKLPILAVSFWGNLEFPHRSFKTLTTEPTSVANLIKPLRL